MIDSEQILKEELRKAFPDLSDGDFAITMFMIKTESAQSNKAVKYSC